jgi:hypothetical protein
MDSRDPKYEEKLYDQFPAGADEGFGPDQGFNTWVRVNDPSLFTDEAKEHPAIRAFLGLDRDDAPFLSVNFAQFKSSHRETEWFIHKPHLAMAGDEKSGIRGSVAGFPAGNPRIATLVINHEQTLARHITKALVIEDGRQAGQMIYKEEDGTL